MCKKILWTISMLIVTLTGYAQKTYVSARILGLQDTQVVFNYAAGDHVLQDTVRVKEEQFTWEAEMPEPQKVYLKFPNRVIDFYVQAGTIHLDGQIDSLDQLTITGSAVQDEALAYQRSLEAIRTQESALHRQRRDADENDYPGIDAGLKRLQQAREERMERFILDNPKSVISLHLVSDKANLGNYESIRPLYDRLDNALLQSLVGKYLTQRVNILKRSRIGESIVDFTQNDTSGNAVQFADFAGQYILVDFWASWCGPCRAENPNVLNAYDQFKDRNFNVIGVSLDEDGNKWKKAILEDRLPWVQVSDLKGLDNAISTYYGIQYIPFNLLVNPAGVIIAKDLRGDALIEKLEELLK